MVVVVLFLLSRAKMAPVTILHRPAGYSRLVFDDKFLGSIINSHKWIPQIADQNRIWTNFGKLPDPFSAVGNAEI